MYSRLKKQKQNIESCALRRHTSLIELCSLASKWLVRALLGLVISVVIAQCLLLGGVSRQRLSPIDELEGIPFRPHVEEGSFSFGRDVLK